MHHAIINVLMLSWLKIIRTFEKNMNATSEIISTWLLLSMGLLSQRGHLFNPCQHRDTRLKVSSWFEFQIWHPKITKSKMHLNFFHISYQNYQIRFQNSNFQGHCSKSIIVFCTLLLATHILDPFLISRLWKILGWPDKLE